MKTITANDAKHDFGSVLASVLSGPIEVTEGGRPLAIVMSRAEFDFLSHGQAAMYLADPAKKQVLDDFADLKISRHEAMNKLGISWHGDLLRLVAAAGKTMRTVAGSDAEAMAVDFIELVRNQSNDE